MLRLEIKPVVLGKRIELKHTDNPCADLKPGDRGTVVDVSELSYEDKPSKVWVLWDSGLRLTVLQGHDDYRMIFDMTMIRNILIITIIAALVPTAMSNVSASAASEIALFSGAPFDSDDQSISGNRDNAKMELEATNGSHGHSTDYFSVGEGPLFGGSIDDGGSSSDSTSESFSPPLQSKQTDGVNTFESDEAREGTSSVFIDPASSDYLTILSQRISTDEILDEPTMDINGEIQNNGTQSIDFVKVTATFYDQSNSILGSDFSYTRPTTLEPGQSAPFKVTAGFGDELLVDEIASIKLHVSGRGDFNTGSKDLGTHGVSGRVHPSDLVSVGGDVSSETASETSSPSSLEQQTEGDNTFGREGNGSQAKKTQDQIWHEQREGQTMKCLVMDPIKEYEEATGQSTEESDETIEGCNHNMLYMLGICEQNNDEYNFCDSVHTYIDDHNLDQISERPTQFNQETIDSMNEFDWNEDGVTDGSDFVSKPL